ncbi:MAG: cbb3-type cytochrome c oxidase subunit I [Deltaproteobacteria bacterium]|nr:cbb3-type cytochrome c oxidase subunit I [Deltaproteobacteria bacterium]
MSHEHDSHHGHELSFIQKYVFSVDHKVIGIQYGITALTFLFFGFVLMMLMRWQLAYPDQPMPIVGSLFPNGMPNGLMTGDFYNELGAMHGTIMIFLGVVPLGVGAFGNYLVPLQVGAPDMAFPKMNAASYWTYLTGGLIMFSSFFLAEGGAAQSGWTSYPPLSVMAGQGQTFWLFGMVMLITSSLLGSVNIIVTIVQLRVPGLSFFKLPFHVWAQFVTSFLLLLAFPPLEAAGVLQLMDRLAGTSFFLPSGLVMGESVMDVAGGGNVVLYQHLFWFLAHPEVYVLILPAIGLITEIIATNTRKPLYGYKTIIYAAIFLGFMSFLVWAHHMFMTGMGTVMSDFFQVTTMIISVPSVVILTVLIITLWGGSIRYNVPMCFALAFLPMFAIGGLTGLPLGLSASDIYLHDTYYVIGHFHYVVAPGTLFALFAAVYHWYPKAVGRKMSSFWGKVHFWGSLISINFVFFPMLLQGITHLNRRMYNYPLTGEGTTLWDIYPHSASIQYLNEVISIAAWVLGAFQLVFIFNFFLSIKFGKKVNDNPWEATTLEWATPTPPPHGNFLTEPTVYRGPYEYSVPGEKEDFSPQHIEPKPA